MTRDGLIDGLANSRGAASRKDLSVIKMGDGWGRLGRRDEGVTAKRRGGRTEVSAGGLASVETEAEQEE
jgi:hypothetical protein